MAETERAYGPYPHRKRWRVIVVGADGGRVTATYKSAAKAQERIDEVNAKASGRTVSAAVDAYVKHLRERNASTTCDTVAFRLRGLLKSHERDRALSALTVPVARSLFAKRATEIAPETQHGELVTASAFASWCVERGWLRTDPFLGLKPTGARARGKTQLRIDEARRFLDACLDENSHASIAAALALLCGMRASSIVKRTVRDVDDGARVLWIERDKTKAGDRHLEIPEVLRAPLAAICAGRTGGEPLFGDVDRHWVGYHVRRMCKVAKVPIVCPHGLRGTHASIAREEVTVDHVARSLGHAGTGVTSRHYIDRGVEQKAQQRAVLRLVAGGRR